MSHSHHHYHGDPSKLGEVRLIWAVAANMLLTLAQVIGGLISGSLSLMADALHNFSDAASLLIALVAIRVGRRPADAQKTFGYRRTETLAAFVNLLLLLMIGFYLMVEAFKRFYAPEPITGWIVVGVAGIALAVDLFTVFLTYKPAKDSLNMKAAFLHNLGDSLASVGVMVSGTLILLYDWVWVDALITLAIAGYILWQAVVQLPKAAHLLMDGAPVNLSLSQVRALLTDCPEVVSVHHLHLWQIDEHKIGLEAHLVLEDLSRMEAVKQPLKEALSQKLGIEHATLEFESPGYDCPDRDEP
ncbi:cation diffusion facilitator family transporter [Thiomicrospira sp. WB1]|jgi:cobalt-zinc-cadmium efflux system protein|uniref:cation diffusion facilitator family transporter n=1 Tax=Thiomicrospira sp. WB1 TaxID=1685380 RepID=UPI00074859D4|nr:cation diffusion facilitator family transporter [Thiomicrospira sp. WB1]KUJ73064.1 cation transporter [Thiomicrospira sp. WB1]